MWSSDRVQLGVNFPRGRGCTLIGFRLPREARMAPSSPDTRSRGSIGPRSWPTWRGAESRRGQRIDLADLRRMGLLQPIVGKLGDLNRVRRGTPDRLMKATAER